MADKQNKPMEHTGDDLNQFFEKFDEIESGLRRRSAEGGGDASGRISEGNAESATRRVVADRAKRFNKTSVNQRTGAGDAAKVDIERTTQARSAASKQEASLRVGTDRASAVRTEVGTAQDRNAGRESGRSAGDAAEGRGARQEPEARTDRAVQGRGTGADKGRLSDSAMPAGRPKPAPAHADRADQNRGARQELSRRAGDAAEGRGARQEPEARTDRMSDRDGARSAQGRARTQRKPGAGSPPDGADTPRRGGGRGGKGAASNKKLRKGRKKRRVLKGILASIAGLILVVMAVGVFYVYSVIKDVPEVNPQEIAASLKVASTMYDDAGNPIKSLYFGDEKRTMATYDQLPENLKNAFVAIEDKTFWEHHGFNFVRIIGAVRDSLLGGGQISGTSTITQQLARNIWLLDKASDRTLERKLQEAYYAVQLEEKLGKEEILTDYLNTIPLGNRSYGVDAAAKSYFNKQIEDLTLLECATLAALPKSPGELSPIETVPKGTIVAEDPRILLIGTNYDYLYRDTVVPRVKLVLSQMLDQELITQAEYDEALADDLRVHLQPTEELGNSAAADFVSWAIEDVAGDLFKQHPNMFETTNEAIQMVYTGGLEIHTSLNSTYQNIAVEEFANPKNFPDIRKVSKDNAGNILTTKGGVISLYHMPNLFAEDGTFTLDADEGEVREDGSMVLYRKSSSRLAIYRTGGSGGPDVSVEFKNMYFYQDDDFYIIRGGIINIPKDYKTFFSEGEGESKTEGVVISSDFFVDHPDFFVFGEQGIQIPSGGYRLDQAVLQPQGAFVLLEHGTGQVKAMVGGRNIVGEMNYNRSINPSQPGSTMKPIGVYGPALEMTAKGEPVSENKKEESYGEYWSPLSIIIDEQMEYGGKVWPRNWQNGYYGPMTFRRCVEQSMNIDSVKIQLNVGNERSVEFLQNLGISTIVEEGATNDMNPAALALGAMTYGVTPLEAAAAYGTFAQLGVHYDPISYTLVTWRNGEVLLDGAAESRQAIDPGTAFIMNDILSTTVTNGIAGRGRIPGVPTAGKTGTAADEQDDWFIANTPKYAASVWIGADVKMQMTLGSKIALDLYKKIMVRVYEGQEAGSFPSAPSNVTRATVSGQTDYFFKNRVPEKLVYGAEDVEICLDSGYRATPWCPSRDMRSFNSLNSDGAAPEYYCHRHNIRAGEYPIDPTQSLDTSFDPNKPKDPPPPDPTSPGGTTPPTGGGVTPTGGGVTPSGGGILPTPAGILPGGSPRVRRVRP